MPQVTVYIRREDLDAWKSVIKKSEFMHNALQNSSTFDGAPIVLRETLPPAPKVKSGPSRVVYNSIIPQSTPVKENKFPPSAASML